MLSRDHYAILGVAPDASPEEIEAAYRHLSRRYHPDLNPGDHQAAAAFERIELAYRILSDPERRERYDGEGRPDPPGPEEYGGGHLRVEPGGEGTGTFRQLFQALQDHARRDRPRKGDEVHVTLAVPLQVAERGRHAAVEVRRLVPCPGCDGAGRVDLEETRTCRRCSGTGSEVFTKGALNVSVRCARCGGDGLESGRGCDRCQGSGLVRSDETVAVRIPPGVVDGQVVRIAGVGHHGPRGGPPGDLVVTCEVTRHEGFERQGPHLLCRAAITLEEAILGGKIPLRALDGEVAVRVPPGTVSGTRLRIRERGLEMPDGRRGDLLVDVELWVPTVVDEDVKQLVREFSRRTGAPPRRRRDHATVQPS